MDKEREIEEIAKTVNNGCRVACSDCRERALCEVRHVAEVLVDEGYRKADDVRKETATEILDKLLTIMPHGYEQVKAFVKVREEEYGVEVDE